MAMVLMLTVVGGAVAMPAAAGSADDVDASDDDGIDADDNDILNVDLGDILSDNNLVDNDVLDTEEGFLIFS